MSKIKVINSNDYTIKVVPPDKHKNTISIHDAEMDLRAVSAVKAALDKAKICKKPIAGYDMAKKRHILNMQMG